MPASRNSASSTGRHRSTLSLQKTEIKIHVYDLLPPGRLSSLLWTMGASLLHSGVVINDREYAYGGHDQRGVTGVYWTKPKSEPPGGSFRCEILHGFTLATQDEIDATLRAASDNFLGASYNLLTKNCNHFSSYLCQKLTGKPGPSWLNRAASIGIALPCVVPRDWIEPPDCDASDGRLLDESGQDETDEQSHMLACPRSQPLSDDVGSELPDWPSDEGSLGEGYQENKQLMRDVAGRRLPAAERAPRP